MRYQNIPFLKIYDNIVRCSKNVGWGNCNNKTMNAAGSYLLLLVGFILTFILNVNCLLAYEYVETPMHPSVSSNGKHLRHQLTKIIF